MNTEITYTLEQMRQSKINAFILKQRNRQSIQEYFIKNCDKITLENFLDVLIEKYPSIDEIVFLKNEINIFVQNDNLHLINKCMAFVNDYEYWYPNEITPMKVWQQEFHNFIKSNEDILNDNIKKLISKIECQNLEINRLNNNINDLYNVDSMEPILKNALDSTLTMDSADNTQVESTWSVESFSDGHYGRQV